MSGFTLRFLKDSLLVAVPLAAVAGILGFSLLPSLLRWFWPVVLIVILFIASHAAAAGIVIRTATEERKARKAAEVFKASLIERSIGFPTLMQAVSEFEASQDEAHARHLETKKHPARKAAETVREQAARRRHAEQECRQTRAILEYYESIAPFLLDFRDEVETDEDDLRFREYDEEEAQDAATNFLAKEEFRSLTSAKRNQLALDRYWARPKSKWLLGRIYERFVGYVFEEQGYQVEYVGIFKGYEDLGRDLICRNNREWVIIQCKNWSKFKTIYEKHIFQFFGTVFQFRDTNPGPPIRASFYTTTSVSGIARRFARELGIELCEEYKMDQAYPCIKCNVSRVDGSRIYHLPFDQQYDNVRIEKQRGEFYCRTVAEAERKGFRRAYRFRGAGAPSS